MTRPETAPAGLRALFTGGTTTGMTDGQLLEGFQARAGTLDREASETAFEALVDRHAAMVWGVCRRGLRDRADAEDAFQATFLVLARKAGSVRVDDRESVGRWLYGVARRVTSRLRRESSRRLVPTTGAASGEDPAVAAERRDVRRAVVAELDRLPLKYRRPIELCDFEGLTYEQAGRFLGWPTATIKSRLARGRSRLKDRLARRGLAPLAAVVAAELAGECRAGVPKALVHSTIRAGAIASGVIPTTVARLAEGAIQTMLWNKLKPLAFLLVAGVGSTTAVLAWSSQGGEPASAPQTAARPEAREPRPDEAPDARWNRRLPDGTTLEVVGVSRSPSGPDTWWRPDGRPLEEPEFDPKSPTDVTGSVVTAENLVLFAVVYRVTGLPVGGSASASVDEAVASGLGEVRTPQGDPATDLNVLRVWVPKATRSLTVRFRIGSETWRTIDTLDTGSTGHGGGKGRNFSSSGAIARKDGGTTLCLAHDVGTEEALRLMAVDESDTEYGAGRSSSSAAGDVRQLVAEFGLDPAKIRKFRIQTRPLDEIVMPDVAAAPVGASPPLTGSSLTDPSSPASGNPVGWIWAGR